MDLEIRTHLSRPALEGWSAQGTSASWRRRRSLQVTKEGFLKTMSSGITVNAAAQTTRNMAVRAKKPGEHLQCQGIGAVLHKTPNGIQIAQTIDGHPANHSGLRPSDYIRAVDGQSAEDMRLSDVIERIRGQQGVSVTLDVERPGGGRFTVEIDRGEVVVDD